MKAAAIQMTSTRDVAANLAEAARLLADAAARGAELAVLPENFSFMGATDAERAAAVERHGDGPAQAFLAEQAERRDRVGVVLQDVPAGGDRFLRPALLQRGLGGLEHAAQFLLLLDFDHATPPD